MIGQFTESFVDAIGLKKLVYELEVEAVTLKMYGSSETAVLFTYSSQLTRVESLNTDEVKVV